jgi:hypothetical protein
MKTIITTLPIYDRLAKQCYERSNHYVKDQRIVISCPNNYLPNIQWLDNGSTSVTRIDLIDVNGNITDITSYFAALPAKVTLTVNSYFVGSGYLSTAIPCGLFYLKITTDDITLYSEWFNAQINTDWPYFEFYNTCDFGDILYQTGFTQNLWINSEAMECTFPIEEEGVKNGFGQFVRSFARQTKTYLIKSFEVPDYLVDVFNRMKLHDTILFTNQFGETLEVYNLVVEHEYIFDDNFYAVLNITFDLGETAVISGCCNNLV